MVLQVVEQRKHRHIADAGRGEGPFPVGPHVAVNHLSVFVRADRHAAVDMGDDKAAVLIALPHGFGMGFRHRLLVQHMGVAVAENAADTGQPRVIAILVHVGRIQGIGGTRIIPDEPPGQQDAELGRVLAAADRGKRIVVKFLVNNRYAAGLGAGAAAAPHDHVD